MRKAIVFLVLLMSSATAYAAFSVIGNGTCVTVGTTATELDDTSLPNDSDRYVLIHNESEDTPIRVGGQTVTASTGILVAPGEKFPSGDKLTGKNNFWAITASGEARVCVQEYK